MIGRRHWSRARALSIARRNASAGALKAAKLAVGYAKLTIVNASENPRMPV
jgi:hypothetical protein